VVKKTITFAGDLLLGTFEMLFCLLLILAAACLVLTAPANPKPSEVLVGDGTLRVGGGKE
jgi:hypothetical protein